jgi:hypothetical protein
MVKVKTRKEDVFSFPLITDCFIISSVLYGRSQANFLFYALPLTQSPPQGEIPYFLLSLDGKARVRVKVRQGEIPYFLLSLDGRGKGEGESSAR